MREKYLKFLKLFFDWVKLPKVLDRILTIHVLYHKLKGVKRKRKRVFCMLFNQRVKAAFKRLKIRKFI